MAADPAGWSFAHDAIEDVLLDGADGEGDALLQDALAGGQDIPEEQRHAALRRLPVVFGIRRLLEWIGSIGVSAVGVSRRVPSVDGMEYVTSMNQLPLLSAWWQALSIAEVIELSPTRVCPGVIAEACHDRIPFEVTEFLAGLVAAQVITNAFIGLDDTASVSPSRIPSRGWSRRSAMVPPSSPTRRACGC